MKFLKSVEKWICALAKKIRSKKPFFGNFGRLSILGKKIFWLCANEFLCRVPWYLLWKNSKIRNTENGHFWPKIETSCASSFLNRFQKFQRIWDLWGIRYLCSQLEKTFKIWLTLINIWWCSSDKVEYKLLKLGSGLLLFVHLDLDNYDFRWLGWSEYL